MRSTISHDFFAGAATKRPVRTYTSGDLCAVLHRVAPFDWAGFLRRWTEGHGEMDTSEGLDRHGRRLTYTGERTPTFVQNGQELGGADLSCPTVLKVANDGRVRVVTWAGPAFRAGMALGDRITAIADAPYTRRALQDAGRNTLANPVTLSGEHDGSPLTGTIDYRNGRRYPHLTRVAGRSDGLAALLTAR